MINRVQQNYKLIDSNEVILSVVIGEEQAGLIVVFIGDNSNDNDEWLTDERTKINNFSLGSASNLKSKVLKISTSVLDKNPNTNRTSVTYFLKGGISPLNVTSEVEVENDNGFALYDAWFKFT